MENSQAFKTSSMDRLCSDIAQKSFLQEYLPLEGNQQSRAAPGLEEDPSEARPFSHPTTGHLQPGLPLPLLQFPQWHCASEAFHPLKDKKETVTSAGVHIALTNSAGVHMDPTTPAGVHIDILTGNVSVFSSWSGKSDVVIVLLGLCTSWNYKAYI